VFESAKNSLKTFESQVFESQGWHAVIVNFTLKFTLHTKVGSLVTKNDKT
jgi:hypothetical protein